MNLTAFFASTSVQGPDDSSSESEGDDLNPAPQAAAAHQSVPI